MNLDDDLLTLWLKGDGLTNDEVRDLVERLQEARDEISAAEDKIVIANRALEDEHDRDLEAEYQRGLKDGRHDALYGRED